MSNNLHALVSYASLMRAISEDGDIRDYPWLVFTNSRGENHVGPGRNIKLRTVLPIDSDLLVYSGSMTLRRRLRLDFISEARSFKAKCTRHMIACGTTLGNIRRFLRSLFLSIRTYLQVFESTPITHLHLEEGVFNPIPGAFDLDLGGSVPRIIGTHPLLAATDTRMGIKVSTLSLHEIFDLATSAMHDTVTNAQKREFLATYEVSFLAQVVVCIKT
jgi:hypothetical protein